MKQYADGLLIGYGQTLELLRITYKSSGVFVYIPRALAERLNLKKNEDHAFVGIYDDGDGVLVLFKDKDIQKKIKPQILEARREYNRFKEMIK